MIAGRKDEQIQLSLIYPGATPRRSIGFFFYSHTSPVHGSRPRFTARNSHHYITIYHYPRFSHPKIKRQVNSFVETVSPHWHQAGLRADPQGRSLARENRWVADQVRSTDKGQTSSTGVIELRRGSSRMENSIGHIPARQALSFGQIGPTVSV